MLLRYLIIMLLFFSIHTFAGEDSSEFTPPMVVATNVRTTLTTGYANLFCYKKNNNCSIRVNAKCAPGYQAESIVSPINSDNEGSKSTCATRGYRISPPSISSDDSGYTLSFSKAYIDMVDFACPNHGVEVMYTVNCIPVGQA